MTTPGEAQAQNDRNSADHWQTCPSCQESCNPTDFGCPACGAPLVDGWPRNYRHRSFCRYCGTLTQYKDGVCRQHRELIALDREPPDPLESLPTMAAQLREEASPRRGMED